MCNRFLRPGWVLRLAIGFVSLAAPNWQTAWAVIHEQVPAIPRHSLVRVHLETWSDGLVVRDRFVPGPRVLETVDFDGVIVGGGEYVIAYVGEHAFEIQPDNSLVTLGTEGGERLPAQVVGIDERLSLLYLKAQFPAQQALQLAAEASAEHLNLLSHDRQDWQMGHPCLQERQQKQWLPVWTLLVAGLEVTEKKDWHGSVALDEQGRLVGFVRHARPHSFSKHLAHFDLVPATVVRRSFSRILKGQNRLAAGWLGVYVEPSDDAFRITKIVAGSPAEKAGLRPLDIVMKLDDQRFGDLAELVLGFRWRAPGSRCRLTINRQGTLREVEVTFAARSRARRMAWTMQLPSEWGLNHPPAPIRLYQSPLSPLPQIGLVVDTLTPQLARQLGSPQGGLLVEAVQQSSAAERMGVEAADILIAINGQAVGSLADVQRVLTRDRDAPLELKFVRFGKVLTRRVSFH